MPIALFGLCSVALVSAPLVLASTSIETDVSWSSARVIATTWVGRSFWAVNDVAGSAGEAGLAPTISSSLRYPPGTLGDPHSSRLRVPWNRGVELPQLRHPGFGILRGADGDVSFTGDAATFQGDLIGTVWEW